MYDDTNSRKRRYLHIVQEPGGNEKIIWHYKEGLLLKDNERFNFREERTGILLKRIPNFSVFMDFPVSQDIPDYLVFLNIQVFWFPVISQMPEFSGISFLARKIRIPRKPIFFGGISRFPRRFRFLGVCRFPSFARYTVAVFFFF